MITFVKGTYDDGSNYEICKQNCKETVFEYVYQIFVCIAKCEQMKLRKYW